MPRYARQIEPTALLEELITYLIPRMIAEEICEQEDIDDWKARYPASFASRIFYNGFSECATKAYDDTCKIDFSMENMTIDPNEDFCLQNCKTWLGPQKFGNLSVIGAMAGGDWEEPLAFVVYHDGKDFRAYVPKEGNSYDLKAKAASGNEGTGPARPFDIEAMKADVMGRIAVR